MSSPRQTRARRGAAPALFALAATLAPSMAARADSAEEVAQRIGADIETEAVDAGRSVRAGRARLVIRKAPADVLAAVTDYASYKEFLPRFEESRVLSRRGDRAMVYLEALVLQGTTTLWAQMRLAPGRDEGETKVIEGRMVRGNMSAFEARWRLTPVDEGRATLVELELLIDLDLPVPASLLTEENVRNSRRALRALRRRLTGE